MKKGLLLISGLSLALLVTSQVSAQDFDYDMTFGQKTANDIKADLTNKAGTNIKLGRTEYPPSSGQYIIGMGGAPGNKAGVLQNGINLYVPNDANNQMVPKDDAADANGVNHGYLRMSGNAKYFLIMESANAISQISLQVGGTTTPTTPGSAGVVEIKYGVLPDTSVANRTVGGTTLDVETYLSVWEASLTTVSTADFGGGASAPPGNVSNFTNLTAIDPITAEPAPVKYARFTSKASGTTTKLFRVAASKTAFVLPLNLLSFNAKADALGKSVNLNWKTTNEVNTKEFLIERRTDNSQFESIGIKASKNVSGEHSYSYTDYTAASGNVYYRLKQVDNDGKFTYSDVVSVNLSGSATVSAYPNPTTDLLNVEHGPVNGGSLSVFDLQGKVLISQSLANGASSTSVNVAKLVPGTYVLNVTNSGKQTTLKFIKN
ncbi:T9SS type A sorting domain-containing protein [Pelobium manganitolerans]|uniref:T9SS type A sorting domain-containing protein n=1 Tax=Pelobium manganitolerans TaxID=1842495 RepID=UPI003FA358EF